MIETNCGNCRFFEELEKTEINQPLRGECRLNPPKVFIVPMRAPLTGETVMAGQTMFPVTLAESWCGEFTAAYHKADDKPID